MHIYKLHAGHCGRTEYGSRHGVGNVVKFQVKKNAVAERGNLFDGFGTSAGEKLAANLEHANQIGNFLRELQRRRQ